LSGRWPIIRKARRTASASCYDKRIPPPGIAIVGGEVPGGQTFFEDMIMAVLKVGSGCVQAGSFRGTFVGVEPVPENKELGYGAGLRFKFRIDAGPFAGRLVSRITTPAPSPNNACGKILGGLAGHSLKEGEQIDPDEFVNRQYMVVVATVKSGATRVEVVVPLPTD
jgi:hypothetical protein